MNTYEYKIIDTPKDAEGVVVAVAFTVTASDGKDSFVFDGYTALPAPNENFIAFDSLDEPTVINWVKNLVQETCENQANVELEAYKKRKVVTNGLPWVL
jgi:hypothetical protein